MSEQSERDEWNRRVEAPTNPSTEVTQPKKPKTAIPWQYGIWVLVVAGILSVMWWVGRSSQRGAENAAADLAKTQDKELAEQDKELAEQEKQKQDLIDSGEFSLKIGMPELEALKSKEAKDCRLVNSTETAQVFFEQYGCKYDGALYGGYLYFTNGTLTSRQNM